MADEEWERKLDERIRWNSFLPLLGTKAFEKLIGNLNKPLAQQFWETKNKAQETAEPLEETAGNIAAADMRPLQTSLQKTDREEKLSSQEKETHENFIPDPGK